MTFLFFLAAAAGAPQPEELRIFEDWTVGCDNGRTCHAVALVPESWPEDALTMRVVRGPEPEPAPEIAFELGEQAGAAALAADGARIDVRLTVAEGMVAVAGADAATTLAALQSAREMEVLGAGGVSLGRISLRGASAALLYMDDRQGRVGTVTALVRPGDKPASQVPAPPAVPQVRAAATAGTPLAVSAAELRRVRKQVGCEIGEVGGPEEHEVTALTDARSLVLLACGSGAYNVSMVPLVAERKNGKLSAAVALFDVEEDWWKEEGKPVLVNAGWDPERGLLSSYSKGRGLGDCGVSRDYAWDGTRFRLVEQAEMGECRGSTDYITTWRAEVVRP